MSHLTSSWRVDVAIRESDSDNLSDDEDIIEILRSIDLADKTILPSISSGEMTRALNPMFKTLFVSDNVLVCEASNKSGYKRHRRAKDETFTGKSHKLSTPPKSPTSVSFTKCDLNCDDQFRFPVSTDDRAYTCPTLVDGCEVTYFENDSCNNNLKKMRSVIQGSIAKLCSISIWWRDERFLQILLIFKDHRFHTRLIVENL